MKLSSFIFKVLFVSTPVGDTIKLFINETVKFHF